jgi:hypothetical protein
VGHRHAHDLQTQLEVTDVYTTRRPYRALNRATPSEVRTALFDVAEVLGLTNEATSR